MAAIKPYLEDDDVIGFDSLDTSHAELVNMVYSRHALERTFQGRRFYIEREGPTSTGLADYKIRIDPIITKQDLVAPWNALPNDIPGAGLLTWTSKMGAPSFSLPAGVTEIGGTCPGATAGQTVAKPAAANAQRKVVLNVLKANPNDPRTQLAGAVCAHCYAVGGSYIYASTQVAQIIRHYWARQALRDGTFVDIMVDAVDRANYKETKEAAHWKQTGWRFFRLHDSGDFGWSGGFEYLKAWKQVADHFAYGNPYGLRPTLIWAPTRIWALGDPAMHAVKQIIGDHDRGNFILRPSGYYLDVQGPEGLGPGWAGVTTVASDAGAEATLAGHAHGQPGIFDWDCQAYAVASGPTCRGARNPMGTTGCRVCWAYPQTRVNYRAH